MIPQAYNLGLVSVSFRQHTPQTILKAMQKTGLTCIEWGSDVHAPCRDTENLHEIARMQKEMGITCSSYGTYFRLGETPMEELPHYIAAAKILGTNILRLWCGSKCGCDYSPEEKQFLITLCRQAAQIAQGEDVILCLECHKGTYTQMLEDALELMHTIDSPHFGMYWQPFQWETEENNLTYAQHIAPFAHHIHVFQWKGDQRFSLNDGIQEWQLYLKQFPTPKTLLLEFMPDDCIDTLPREVEALKKIIGDVT